MTKSFKAISVFRTILFLSQSISLVLKTIQGLNDLRKFSNTFYSSFEGQTNLSLFYVVRLHLCTLFSPFIPQKASTYFPSGTEISKLTGHSFHTIS